MPDTLLGAVTVLLSSSPWYHGEVYYYPLPFLFYPLGNRGVEEEDPCLRLLHWEAVEPELKLRQSNLRVMC